MAPLGSKTGRIEGGIDISAPSQATNRLLARVGEVIEERAEEIAGISDAIMRIPELGFEEHRTAALVSSVLTEAGIPHRTGLAGTGIKAVLRGRSPGPTVALLGELDGVLVPGHPLADRTSGAAPACGHHAQLASMIGAAFGLQQVMPELDGSVALMAVPAEEMRPPAQLAALRRESGIEFPVGKAELLRLGELDDVDLAMLVHTGRENGPRFSVGDTLNAALGVTATFHGRSAHAGSSPWLGIDASRAARLAITAIEAQHETFPGEDSVRIHVGSTAPESAPGAVDAACTLDVLVRARSTEALADARAKVERSLRAGALALGAGLTVSTSLAYLPTTPAPELDRVVARNATRVIGPDGHAYGRHLGASSDMGDLSHVMPVSHPYASGAVGGHHGVDYLVKDHRQAAVEPALYLAGSVVDLLADGAAEARRVLAAATYLTTTEYVELRRSMSTTYHLDPDEGMSS